MRKTLFSLITLFALSLSQAQTVGDYTVVDQGSGNYYLSGTTASGTVTFPTTIDLGGSIGVVDITGVDVAFNNSTDGGVDITNLTIPVGYITFEGNCFRNMGNLESITFNGGEVFGDKMMRGLDNLTTVVLPNTITSWGVEMFSDGAGVETIDLGNCPTINSRMFQKCPITELTLPATVTSIGAQAWKDSKIVTLTVEGTTPPVIDAGWLGNAANITAYVPASEISAYQNAPIWEDMTILASPVLSIDSSEALNVNVYLSNGTLFVEGENNVSITVYDITGKALLSNTGNQVDVSALSEGIYIVKGNTNGGVFAKRVLKQ